MPVVLIGVGADTNNLEAPRYPAEGGSYQFTPMPEKTPHSTETLTCADIDGVNMDIIEPDGKNEEVPDKITDPKKIARYPVHNDPNFEAATYGEGGKQTNVDELRWLKDQQAGGAEEVAVGFYTGLLCADGSKPIHRYLIGYMIVEEIYIIDEKTPEEKKRKILEANPENAHTKRFKGLEEATDEAELYVLAGKSGPDTLTEFALVDGKSPGVVLSKPLQISVQMRKEERWKDFERDEDEDPGPRTYYLGENFINEFNVGDEYRRRSLSRKPPIRLNLDVKSFENKVSEHK